MYKINTESIGDVKKYVWHYRKGNKEYGPFTYEDIIELVKKGEIGPDEYVLKFGNKKFVKVSEVQGLFEIIEQRGKEKEEEIKMPEEQAAVSKEVTKEEVKEGSNEEPHAALQNRTTHIHSKSKQGASLGPKIAMIMAGAAGLCLVVWLLKLLF